MDFAFSDRHEALRADVRSFLKSHLSESDVPAHGSTSNRTEESWEAAGAFNAALAARGWIAPAWPREYGGLGASIYEQMVFSEELGHAGAPDNGTRGFGVGMVGNTLILHGSEEQKAHYLPRITGLRDLWCQGYSEPSAGSDLASIQTRATRDGDVYVLRGQKIWTSNAHRADHMFCLVQTDPDAPKHRGLSFLLIDDLQHLPGVSIRPLLNLANRHRFNEVFFDDARVPVANRVGDENRGWYVAMSLLEFERSGIGTTAAQRRALETLVAAPRPGILASQRVRLADLVITNRVARVLGYRIGYLQSVAQRATYEASLVKLLQAELGQRIAAFAVGMLGLPGQLILEERAAPFGGEFAESYLQSVSATIHGGTAEIQRNIIATRGLALPRS